MEQISEEQAEQYTRVCAIDIGKASLVACVRVPHESNPARCVQEVREYPTVTPALLQLADWLRCQQVQVAAMEATSSYWKPVFYLLEAEGFECWLLNARHVKKVPGRPKTDKLDAVWLAKVVERGMGPPAPAQPKPIRRLRDLTRYRRSLIRDQTREKLRLEKAPEDAQIKLDAVINDLHGVYPAGKFAPIDKQSAGRAETASTGKGNPWLAGALGEIVAGPHRHVPQRPLPPAGP